MGRMLRGLRIWRAVLTLLLFLWWDSQTWTYRGGPTPERRAARQQVRARWLTAELLQLGSAFIKLGQLLSARPDILPAGWVAELASLQDSVPAFPFEQVQTVLEEELGPRCAEVIDLDPVPLGAASLAQVHRASLRSGRQVVLKIQRPGLDTLFRLDLEVMQQVAAVMQRHPSWGRGRDWPAMARECRRVLLRELDFRVEAQYAARFRQQFLDDERIRIPAVIWEQSTRRVLCLDYLPGIKVNDREALLEAGVDPSAVAEIGAASYLKQLVRFGFFHADPHPGNLAVASDGALIYYDFGMMGLLSDGLRRRLGSMVRAAAARDSAELVAELQGKLDREKALQEEREKVAKLQKAQKEKERRERKKLKKKEAAAKKLADDAGGGNEDTRAGTRRRRRWGTAWPHQRTWQSRAALRGRMLRWRESSSRRACPLRPGAT